MDALLAILRLPEADSRQVIQAATQLLEKYSSSLGDEVWQVREQLFIALLDDLPHHLAQAQQLLKSLEKRFSEKSLRVQRLRGLLSEAKNDYTQALSIYDKILAQDSNYVPALKRKIAILKARGRVTEAIEALVKYLEIYMTDAEAWQELCELYLLNYMYAQAAFCVEELILLDPHNPNRHLKLAALLYTQGGLENVQIAKKYYCKVLELSPSDVRALWGLKLCCRTISTLSRVKDDTDRVQELTQFANDKLRAIYATAPTRDIVYATIDSL